MDHSIYLSLSKFANQPYIGELSPTVTHFSANVEELGSGKKIIKIEYIIASKSGEGGVLRLSQKIENEWVLVGDVRLPIIRTDGCGRCIDINGNLTDNVLDSLVECGVS